MVLMGSGYFVYHTWVVGACDRPLTFKINSIDQRFSLPQADAIKYVTDAAEIWNKGTGKKLLAYQDENKKSAGLYNKSYGLYTDKPDVIIDFVYDERQKTTIQNNILSEEIKVRSQSLKDDKSVIGTSLGELNSIKGTYEADLSAYQSDLNIYNQKVAMINARGGAKPDEYDALNSEKEALNQKRNVILTEENNLNNYLSVYNADVKNYNNKVVEVNNIVQKVNGNSLGQYEEGFYQNGHITFYEYTDINTLKRLATHELGHALGFDHVKNRSAIMYYINQGKSLKLTPSDIDEYKRVCGVK